MMCVSSGFYPFVFFQKMSVYIFLSNGNTMHSQVPFSLCFGQIGFTNVAGGFLWQEVSR